MNGKELWQSLSRRPRRQVFGRYLAQKRESAGYSSVNAFVRAALKIRDPLDNKFLRLRNAWRTHESGKSRAGLSYLRFYAKFFGLATDDVLAEDSIAQDFVRWQQAQRGNQTGSRSAFEPVNGQWHLVSDYELKLGDEILSDFVPIPPRASQRGDSYEAQSQSPKQLKRFLKVPTIPTSASRGQIKEIKKGIDDAFQREMNSLKQLKRIRGVAKVYGVEHAALIGNDGYEHKIPVLVQQFVPGKDLDVFFDAEAKKIGVTFQGLPPAEWKRLAYELFRILSQIHKRGIVHGDLRPANIRVTSDKRLVLVDFGQCLMLTEHTASRSSSVYPDDAYAAPERRSKGPWESPADIYSAGAVLFYASSGLQPPKERRGNLELRAEIARMMGERNQALINQVPEAPDMIAQCLHYRVSDRAARAEDLTRVLSLFEEARGQRKTQSKKSIPSEQTEKLEKITNYLRRLGSTDQAYTLVARLLRGLPTLTHRSFLFSRIAVEALQDLVRNVQEMKLASRAEIDATRQRIVGSVLAYFSMLQKDDRYLTTTMPSFWTRGNLGLDGRFLRMNVELAKQGVRMRRVLLITRGDLQAFKRRKLPLDQILAAQRQAVSQVRSAGINTEDRSLDGAGYYVGCKLISPETRRRIVRDGYHIALITPSRGETHVSLSFQPDQSGLIRRVYLWEVANSPELEAQVRDMAKLLDSSVPIEQFDLDFAEIVSALRLSYDPGNEFVQQWLDQGKTAQWFTRRDGVAVTVLNLMSATQQTLFTQLIDGTPFKDSSPKKIRIRLHNVRPSMRGQIKFALTKPHGDEAEDIVTHAVCHGETFELQRAGSHENRPYRLREFCTDFTKSFFVKQNPDAWLSLEVYLS